MISLIDLSVTAVIGVCLIAICFVNHPAAYKVIAAVLATSMIAGSLASARHAAIQRYRQRLKWPVGFRKRTPQVRSNDYYVFVLGSGGHTKEMLMMMDDGHLDFGDVHRRYIISSGDKMSNDHVLAYETDLKARCDAAKCRPGTYDLVTVPRARKVHQSIWTTPFSAFSSVMGILPALLSPPEGAAANTIRVPSKVFSNGPATGFFVAATIYLLKILFMVSSSDMSFIYIESWARVSTLSLTGKLLYYTDVADLMVVQHYQVAKTYGLTCVGPMVFNARRDVS